MRSALIFLVVISIASCLDTIDLDLPNSISGRIVVDGVAEKSADMYRFLVSVRRTQNLVADTATHLEPAKVWVLYNEERIFQIENGVDLIIPIDSFERTYGISSYDDVFNVEIEIESGEIFRSENQRILIGNHSSKITVGYEEREELNDFDNTIIKGYVKLFISTVLVNDKEERVSALWTVRGEYRFLETAWTEDPLFITKHCYVKDPFTFNRINVFDARTSSTGRIEMFELGETNGDYRFNAGYYFTVIQRAISHEAAEYWDEVRGSISREGTIFDTPVGAIRSNISQIAGEPVDVLGYFYTAGIDTVRYLAGSEETGFQGNLCALTSVTEECCDCLLLRNSTIVKPSYWIE